jgi:fluoride exporter
VDVTISRQLAAYLWVGIGSALGGVSRFWLSGAIADRFGGSFPWGTMAVNVTGSFVIGFLGALTSPEGRLSPRLRPFTTQFFMFGICGGYTTFSSFSLQTLSLARDGEWLYAGGNILLSVVLCLAGVWLGFVCAKALGG